jgi:hypothetical protein
MGRKLRGNKMIDDAVMEHIKSNFTFEQIVKMWLETQESANQLQNLVEEMQFELILQSGKKD